MDHWNGQMKDGILKSVTNETFFTLDWKKTIGIKKNLKTERCMEVSVFILNYNIECSLNVCITKRNCL